MAAYNSTVISNILASPQVIDDKNISQKDFAIKTTFPLTAPMLGTNGNVVYMVPLSWSSKIHSIRIFNDRLDTATASTLNVGLYRMTLGGTFTVLDDDAYAAALQTLRAANTAGVEVAFATRDIANIGNTVHQDAGSPASKEGIPVLSLSFPAAAGTPQAGDITLIIEGTY